VGNEAKDGHSKDFSIVNGAVQELKPCKLCDDVDETEQLPGMCDSKSSSYINKQVPKYGGNRGSTVVKVLCYKSEGRWFDPSWCQWIFSFLPLALGSTRPLTEMSTRSISWG